MLKRRPTERERIAEQIAARLDIPFTALGVLGVLVFVAWRSSPDGSDLQRVLLWSDLVLVAVFAFEYVLRVIIAPSTGQFLRRNWWQLLFIGLPFLRVFRIGRAARVARLASTSAGAARAAGASLRSRLAWLATVSVGVILASSELLYEYGPRSSYPETLHDTALATLGGEPIGRDGFVPEALEILLVVYNIVIIAALAAALGAFFVEGQGRPSSRSRSTRRGSQLAGQR